MTTCRAYAAPHAGAALEPISLALGPLHPDEVEVQVEYCGVCHSDLSVIDNEWGNSRYPVVGGHEIVGRITALGSAARGLQVGQRVGIGWTADSCQHCNPCISGHQQLCSRAQATIVGHSGGFAERVRASWPWVIPLPDGLDAESAGPLLCGGITVFYPLLKYGIRATDTVGVIGMGGLGHMAIKFLRAMGCRVVAFSSNPAKREEILAMGADDVVSSTEPGTFRTLRGQLSLLISTVNVPLDWPGLLTTLAPQGRLHVVGAVLEPMPIPAFSLIGGDKSVSGSPTGSPHDLRQLVAFAARHDIRPQVEVFPMSQINAALEHVRAGKARYRVVLKADF